MQRLASVARLCVKCTSKRPQTITPIHQSLHRIQTNFSALSFHTTSLARADEAKDIEANAGETADTQAVDENADSQDDDVEADEEDEAEPEDLKTFLETEAETYKTMIDDMNLALDQAVIAERDREPASDSFGYNTVDHEDGSVEFEVNPHNISQHFDDPTVYSDNMDDINARIEKDQPLTVTQKITLMKKWVDDIEADPRTAFQSPDPMITWTHPNKPGARPGFHPPRMDEKFVQYDFDADIVKSMSAEELRKSRRGTVNEFVLERQVYENKMHDVRKYYMSEFQIAKQRREANILREWTANKAAKEVRSRERKGKKESAATIRREREKAEFEQRLLVKRDRAISRIHRDIKMEERKAQILEKMLQERQESWINTDESSDWGMKINEDLFNRTETNITGFWPKRNYME